MLKIIYEKEDIYKRTSAIIKQSINKTLLKKKYIVLGLPGGRSISKILNNLKNEVIDWEKVHIFMIDERIVPLEDPDSNYNLIKKCLTGIVPEKNLHPFSPDMNDIKQSLKEYEQEIENYGGIFDIILLSSGEDGHVGSLFPEHPSIINESDFFISVNNSPKPPSDRMSISKSFLLRSNIGVLLFIGESKREAYSNFLDSKKSHNMCPASLIRKLNESYVLTDIKL